MTAPNGPILFNSSTGSDTQASGLGPATAVFGTTGSSTSASAVVTGIDTTGVSAGDLFWGNTSSGRQFSIIASVDSGSQVTLDDNLAATHSGNLTWAIGGKRASIGGTSSKKLFDNGGAAGDSKPGWIMEMESGHAETINSELGWRSAGSESGPIVLRGTSGAATPPIITSAASARLFRDYAGFHRYENFTAHSTAPKGSFEFAFWSNNYPAIVWRRVKVSSSSSGNDWTAGIVPSTGGHIIDCDISGCDDGIWAASSASGGVILRNKIHGCGDRGIEISGNTHWGMVIKNNLIVDNFGDGIYLLSERTDTLAATLLVAENIIAGNGGDGLEIATWNWSLSGNVISANIFDSNGGYGINFSNGSATAIGISGYGVLIDRNSFRGNTSGKHIPSDLYSLNEIVLTADPFVDAANDDFNINSTSGGGAALRAATITLPG